MPLIPHTPPSGRHESRVSTLTGTHSWTMWHPQSEQFIISRVAPFSPGTEAHASTVTVNFLFSYKNQFPELIRAHHLHFCRTSSTRPLLKACHIIFRVSKSLQKLSSGQLCIMYELKIILFPRLSLSFLSVNCRAHKKFLGKGSVIKFHIYTEIA